MRKPLLFSILFAMSLILVSCASGQYVKNPERELKAEKIYVKRVGDKISYKIKVTNISWHTIYLTTKHMSPYSPDGKLCEYSEKDSFLHLVYSGWKVVVYYSPKVSLGDKIKRLERNESHVFSGTVNPTKCKFIRSDKSYEMMAKNVPEPKNGIMNFIISIDYKIDASCGHCEYSECEERGKCEGTINRKEFELWSWDTIKMGMDFSKVIVSQFIFEFDEEKDEKN